MIEQEPSDTLEDEEDPKSSEILLAAIKQAEKSFSAYNQVCQQIDDLYSLQSIDIFADDKGNDFQLFWASMEILKPSVYSRPPIPVVAPKFKDRDPVINTASQMLERGLISAFDASEIDEVMLETRDDLALNNRGVQWLSYEDEDGQKVCIEHLDRTDFLHEPARKWADVGWVARRAWMTRMEMRDRFGGTTYEGANFTVRHDDVNMGSADKSEKAGVWEVWSKTDGLVYWVTDGVPTILDHDKPHLNLKRFFPCPRPAYGTKRRRSLVPVPDYLRYSGTLDQISELTTRVYDLLREVRLKGFFPAGGDIGQAVETAIADQNSSSILIPVPAAAFMGAAGGQMVQWLPLSEIATAIQGLLQARGQLIQDFYEISGISDIMRGATDAGETLGAQQLKQHNGSIRVKDKIDELTRIAAETAQIAGEIMAEHFSQKTLMDMSQMQIRTKAEIKRSLSELEKTADSELRALGDKAKQALEGQQVPPEQAQQLQAQFQQEQQAIIGRYEPQIKALGEEVSIDDVMRLLRDDRTRGFVIEIETDSTVLTDDIAEKSSRAEFLAAFSTASQAVVALSQAGPAGAELGGGMVKFALAPFRVGREMDAMIDKFAEEAAMIAGQGGPDDGSAALAEAQGKLAEAEMQKAQAQMAKVEADTTLKQAEGQRKMMEAQAKAQSDQGKMQMDMIKLQQSAADGNIKAQEAQAKIDQMKAQTMKLLTEAGVMLSEQQLSEFNSLADIELRKAGQVADAARPVAGSSGGSPQASGPKEATQAHVTTANQVMEGLSALMQMMSQQSAALATIAAVVSAPKEIVRGPDGRAMGVRTIQ
ncbi:MAG: hypothetical protein ACRCXM_08965 [Beijerinckiaceae bacterium]